MILVSGWRENVNNSLKDEWLPDCRISTTEVDSHVFSQTLDVIHNRTKCRIQVAP